MSQPAIGGYFELQLPAIGGAARPHAIRFQSGRAAFLALLRQARPSRVWMPRYICDSMRAPLRAAGVDFAYYDIDDQLNPVGDIPVKSGEWLYYVDYFGVCAGNVARLLEKYDRRQIVLDFCQAWYAEPVDCVATIYSPRKFFGVPDGGLLITSLPVEAPREIDTGSAERAHYLLERLAFSAEAGYSAYKSAEQSLEAMEPKGMSHLTERLLASTAFDESKVQRNRNFAFLHQKLGHLNRLSINLAEIDGPLCYPFFVDTPALRDALIANKIFVPTYWPDVLDLVEEHSIEARLVRSLIPLPCDQRYGAKEMERIMTECEQFFRTKSSNGSAL